MAADAMERDRMDPLETGEGTGVTGAITGASVESVGVRVVSPCVGMFVGVPVRTGAMEIDGAGEGSMEGPSEGMSLGTAVTGISATW